MSIQPRTERDERPYEHRFHAGNVGDVLKHMALVALLERSRTGRSPVTYVDTHAGAGAYRLGPTGEWREGVGRLLERMGEGAPALVERYVSLLDDEAPGKHGMRYPGSPVLAARALSEEDRLVAFEVVEETARQLSSALGSDGRAEVVVADGVAALAGGLGSLPDGDLVVVVDPPWVEKAEWTRVPDALIAAARERPNARFLLWYPVKSHTRPNAMMKRLQDARLAATLAELVTSPLTVKKNRLNGSGLILVRPPEGLVEALAGSLAWLGAHLATHDGYWSQRVVSWGAREGPPAFGSSSSGSSTK